MGLAQNKRIEPAPSFIIIIFHDTNSNKSLFFSLI